ncbi:unnamed protein product [Rotaria socialis]|uniref:Paraquat-inducible protein A n=1 Tax=Rotaria socialis TaxID=392032 RepID=A0A818GDS0_9BILA|nr:unnamed protein product [Rotaria socialis]CAF3428098.1 unnamed protein product [Rotaria socialis]CAF3457243.1 unnamed protein product [Rotaria socialis]CAF3469293.1 unnamed protein product [Rotaria socialis]CAF3487039.1 unnamed protein product [Rotaria socialis]
MDASSDKLKSYQSLDSSNIDDNHLGEPRSNNATSPNTFLSVLQNQWANPRIRNWIYYCLVIISLLVLIPGLWCSMIDVHIYTNFAGTRLVVASQRTSILSTISYLFDQGRYLPGILIIIFAVVTPIIKSILLLLMNNMHKSKYNYLIYTIIRDWEKWNMADVFTMSVFLAFLSSAFIKDIEAKLLAGFYCFLVYCIVSVIAVRVMWSPSIPNDTPEEGILKTIETVEQTPSDSFNDLSGNKSVQDNNPTAISMDDILNLNKLNESKNH